MKFPLFYADPCWQFATWSARGKGRSPEQHYDCMSLDEIKALPLLDLAADNAVLLMWVIDTLLAEALAVIDAWGFTYKTVGFYWAKVGRGFVPRTGMGYWTRANPEQCLLATRGEPDIGLPEMRQCLLATRGRPKRVSKNVPRLVFADTNEHSEKPHEIYGHIENLVAGPYLELFARHARTGWHQWGNEVGKLGGIPNLVHLPGYPARACAPDSLFGVA